MFCRVPLMLWMQVLKHLTRLGLEPRTHCVLVGAPIETSKHPQEEDAFKWLSDSAGVRTQDPLRFGRGTYKKKHHQEEDAFKWLSYSAGVRTQAPLRFGRGTYKKSNLFLRMLLNNWVIRLWFEPRTHCVLVGAPIETSKHPQKEDAFKWLSYSAVVRTQDPLRFGRGTYKKKHPQKRGCF